MSRWFRFYADAMRHPKVVKLSDRDFRMWVALLSVAAENDGMIPPVETLKRLLKARLDHLLAAVERLLSVGLIDRKDDGFVPHNWGQRQYKSDTSTERVRKHREKRNVSSAVSETPPDTDTDTETDKKHIQNGVGTGQSAGEFDRIETACRSAAGVENHPSPGLLIIAPILELLRQGFDLEVDVLPSIRRQAKGRSPRTTWSYFVPGIIDDRNKRLAIGTAARGSVEAEGPVDQRSLEASWKWALDQEAKTGAWPSRSIRKSEIPKAFIDRHRSEAAAKHTAA